ncbi:MAG: SLATT domain-containing protein, partial [Pseudomonadota bacterium]
GKLLETWMGKRALAESHRISYFEGLITKAAGLSTESALLTLEYFRRYQFDNQKAYYQRRSREHDISAKRTVAIGAVGAGVATLAGASGVVTAGQETWLGAFTIFGSALGAFAIGREQMTQDRRNAERYTRTYSSLVELTKRLDSVRQAVSGGNTRAAVEFVKVVDEQLSTEHRQWLKETEATNEAIARLDEALKETANG